MLRRRLGQALAGPTTVRTPASATTGRGEVFDVVARCEEAVDLAEAAAQPEIAFPLEGVRRVLLGRLMGRASALDG